MTIHEYAFTHKWADGSMHTDTVYVEHPEPVYAQGCDKCGWTSSASFTHTCGAPTRQLAVRLPILPESKPAVWNVQDYPSESLAWRMPREHAAKWLRIRHAYANGDRSVFENGWFNRRTQTSSGGAISVPNKPVDAYAEDKIVLHSDEGGLEGYGYKSGETVEGITCQEQRLDSGNYDDFHRNTECEVHGDRLLCPGCGHEYNHRCEPPECDCEAFDFSTVDTCPGCAEMYACESGTCDCINKLEGCAECNRDLGDGDTVWIYMDGGEVYCPEHIIFDERPSDLFKRVGGVRGAHLPEFAWPGGYCRVYFTKDGSTVCADCADQVETSDPVVAAEADEEMNCQACDHAQSFHASEKGHRTDGNSDDVGPCNYDEHQEDISRDLGIAVYRLCDCVGYFPPLCDDCNRPIDPALRQWWASKNTGVTA